MNFEEGLDRVGTDSAKWDFVEEYYGKEDVLPMWVADSDWKTSEAIIEALKRRVEHGAFGYSKPGEEHDKAVVEWIEKRYDWKIDPEWIVYTNSMTSSLSVCVRTFTDMGDSVVLQPPVYHPFFSVVENNGARVANNELLYDKKENEYTMDFEDLKEKFEKKDSLIERGYRTSMMILCSPHNPVGRVWTDDELERLADLALENDILVVSDEIFSDYIFEGSHTPFSSLSKELEQNSITMLTPAKSFNIAGLNIGLAIIPNSKLRRRFQNSREKLIKKGNILGLTALKAAYTQGESWLEAQLDYLEENKDFAVEFVKKEIPKVEAVEPEGTFLLWMDFKDLGLGPKELNDLILEEAEVALIEGSTFSSGGEGFMRLNLGCPRSTLKEGLERIKDAVEGY